MSIETTPASTPDPEWDKLVSGLSTDPVGKPVGPVLQKTADVPVNRPDLLGDMPLTPEWARTPTGWRARAAVGKVNSVRAFRRWVRRQNTEHGHGAQVFRGMHRTFLWTQGTEGVQIGTARREVQQAQADYKRAKFGHDRRLVPGKEKDRRRREMETAFASSVTAMTKYKSARKDARTRRAVRGTLAAAAIAVPEGAGLYLAGGTGGLIATGATLAALALIGRRTMGGELYDDHDVKFGDTLTLTDSMLNKVYRDAKVIGADEVVELLTPCALTADGKAWEVTFDLPSGTPLKKALTAKTGVASALGVKVQQLHQSPGDREGRLQLRVSLHLPFTGRPDPGPLLDLNCVNLWRAIPMGVNLRGQGVETSWVERSGLFGGEPGAGKSAAANDLLLAAALDPTVALYLCDGKAGADITPFEQIAAMYDTDGEPERAAGDPGAHLDRGDPAAPHPRKGARITEADRRDGGQGLAGQPGGSPCRRVVVLWGRRRPQGSRGNGATAAPDRAAGAGARHHHPLRDAEARRGLGAVRDPRHPLHPVGDALPHPPGVGHDPRPGVRGGRAQRPGHP
ncbi:hypothetical protein RB201_04325 [Streptomyces sp. S1A(2023)]